MIHVPVSSSGSYYIWKIGSANGTASVVSSLPSLKSTTSEAAQYVLPLDTGALPALGASVFQLRFVGDDSNYSKNVRSSRDDVITSTTASVDQRSLRSSMRSRENGDVEISNGLIQLVFDG